MKMVEVGRYNYKLTVDELPYGSILRKLGLKDPDIRNIDIEFAKNFLSFYGLRDAIQMEGFLGLVAKRCIEVVDREMFSTWLKEDEI